MGDVFHCEKMGICSALKVAFLLYRSSKHKFYFYEGKIIWTTDYCYLISNSQVMQILQKRNASM